MQTEHRKKRNAAIDLIRGTSILYIVGYWHLFNYTKAFPEYNNLVTCRLTIIVLGLFVMVSGYLIGVKAILPNTNDIFIFYKTKMLRIYPPYIFSIVLFYVLRISEGTTLAKSAILISMFLRPAPLTLWFITMIVIFYIIAPLLVINSSSITKYIILCLFLFTTTYIYSYLSNFLDIRILMYFPVFATGILLARHDILLYKINITIIALLLIPSVIISFISINPNYDILSVPLAFIGSLLIFVIAIRKEKSIGKHRSIEMLCYASFFMYLFHRPLFKVLHELYFPASSVSQILYLLTICLPLIVAISWLGQKAYDQLILQLTRHFT